jgi:Ran GTPase-activating protein (RanGAP) involved in mRNA processing and transport
LRELDLSYNLVNAPGAAALASSAFPELRWIDLNTNQIGSAGAKALADGRALPALAAIDLSENEITDPETMSALIAGPALPVLAGLNLSNNRARKLDPKRLTVPGRGPTLRLLSLRHCELSAKSGVALAACPALTGLVGLDLAGNNTGDEGATALARTAKWDNLVSLDLGQNGITAAGVKALVEWPVMAKLTLLDLGENPIGLKGAEALAGCKALKKCRKLVVPFGEPNMPPAGLKLLKKTFGRRLASS